MAYGTGRQGEGGTTCCGLHHLGRLQADIKRACQKVKPHGRCKNDLTYGQNKNGGKKEEPRDFTCIAMIALAPVCRRDVMHALRSGIKLRA